MALTPEAFVQLQAENERLRQRVSELEQQTVIPQQHNHNTSSLWAAAGRALINKVSNTITLIFDHDLRYLEVSGTGTRRGGFTRDMLLNRTIWEVLPPDICVRLEPCYRAALNGEEQTFLIHFFDGVYQVRVLPLYNNTGHVIAGMAMARDQTMQLELETRLHHSQEMLHGILRHAPAIVAVKDVERRYMMVNQYAAGLIKTEADQLLGKRDEDLFPEVFAAAWRDTDLQVLATGETASHEDIIPLGQELRIFLSTKFPLHDEDGNLYAIATIATDITERKQTEQMLHSLHAELEERVKERTADLQKSEARYRRISELMSDFAYAFRLEADGTLSAEWVTDAAQNILGFDFTQITSLHDWEQNVYPDDIPYMNDCAWRTLQGDAVESEYRFIRNDNQVRWLYSRSFPVFDEQQQRVTHVYGVVQDITERKQADEQRQQAEHERNRFFQVSTDMLCIINSHGYFKQVNPAFVNMLGYSAAELKSMQTSELIHPEDLATTRRQVWLLANGVPSVTFENRYLCKDGSYRWLFWSGTADRSKQLIYAAARDISERKQLERELLAREERFRSFVTNSPDTIYVMSIPAQQLLFCNRETFCGYTHAELDSPGSIMHALHPDDYDAVCSYFQQVSQATDHQIHSMEYRLFHKNGSLEWVHSRATALDCTSDGLPQSVLITLTLITDRKHTSERLALLAQAVEQTSDAVVVTDARLDPPGPRIVFVNPAFCQMTGYTYDELIGQTPQMLQVTETDSMLLSQLKQALNDEQPFTAATINYRKDGTPYHVEWHTSPIYDEQQTVTHYVSVQRDVSAQVAAGVLSRDQHAILEMMVKGRNLSGILYQIVRMLERQRPTMWGSIRLFRAGHITHDVTTSLPPEYGAALNGMRVNPQTEPGGLAAATGQIVIVPDVTQETRWQTWRDLALHYNIHACWIVPIVTRDGTVQGTVSLYTYKPGWPDEPDYTLLETASQMTTLALEQRQLQDRIVHQAYHDTLTGLPNRLRCIEYIQQALTRAIQDKSMVAVCFIDIDHFKQINNVLGHTAGDQLLTQAAVRFQQTLHEYDLLARVGGDEFTLVLTRVRTVEEVVRRVQECLGALALTFLIDERELGITASVGISLAPQDGTDATALVQYADRAMQRARASGTSAMMFFSPEMTTLTFELLTLEHQLRQAVARSELVVYYQPQVDISGQQIIGVEALLRWFHPERGMVSPGEFIPLAEESGLIMSIGEWVLRQVCQQGVRWQREGILPPRIAVNVSALQLARDEFVTSALHILAESGMPSDMLDLEITESIMLQDHTASARRLEQLRTHDIRIIIDDFGMSYSWLSYLGRFPVDSLKIDRSFVHTIDSAEHQRSTALVQTIVNLAHTFNLQVIAEGVETVNQMRFLQQVGCDGLQGYLTGRPMSVHDIDQLLRQHYYSGLRAHLLASNSRDVHPL